MAGRLTREEARERTREAILEAAHRLFSERGYRGASIDDIAETAGYSKGAVYSNWAGKDALFLELLERQSTRSGETERIDTSATGWALATLDFFVEAVHKPETRDALAERYRQVRHEVGSGMAAGRPDPDWASWEEIASIAMALGSGLIIQSAVDGEAVDPSLAGRVMEQLLGRS
jgi:AcrR family transcriptional regulator